MKIEYHLENGKGVVDSIGYCCDVMKQAIENYWVEIDNDGTFGNPPTLIFETDGTWIGISNYCYNCGRKVEKKEVKAK